MSTQQSETAQPSSSTGQNSKDSEAEKVRTPLQQSLQISIDQLASEGKPHPKVTFESNIIAPSQSEREALIQSGGSFDTKVVAKTVIEYDSPQQAGKSRWDDIIINGKDAASKGQGTIHLEGNLTQMLIEAHPEIYGEDGYEYGEEPRTFVIDENVTTTFVHSSEVSVLSEGSGNSQTLSSSNVVMGFSIVPDRIDYSINPKWKSGPITIAEAKAGFILDVGFGLRLPVRVDVTTSDSTVIGGQQDFKTSITPLDFNAEDYERIGIPPEDGHEFFARSELFMGFQAWFLGKTIIKYAIDSNVDLGESCTVATGIDCQDFVTPFGLDENGVPREFPLRTLEFSPDKTGLELDISGISIGLGLKIDPEIGSDRITADWSLTGNSYSKGEIIYSAASPAQYSFGQIEPTAMTSDQEVNDETIITIDNYKFHLTRQIIRVLGNVQFEFFGHDVYESRYWTIIDFNFTSVFGESSIGQHRGTSGVLVSWSENTTSENPSTIVKPEVVRAAGSNATLTVATDQVAYTTGDTVVISGYSALTGVPIVVQVFNPLGAAYRIDLIPNADIDDDGKFSYSFKIGGELGKSGTYKVVISESKQNAETTFSFN